MYSAARNPQNCPFLIDHFCKGFRKPALERGIRHRERIWMNEIPFNEAVCQIAQNPEVASNADEAGWGTRPPDTQQPLIGIEE